MKTGFTVKTMIGIALMCVLIILSGWVVIPSVIPFTLQTLGIFLAIGLLGTKGGTLAVLIYLLLGTVGLPVFAGMKGGMGVLMGPTGGYLVGFLLTAILAGLIIGDCQKPLRMALGFAAGLLLCYAFGTVWFLYGYTKGTGLWGALVTCVFPYLLPDAVKICAAVFLIRKVQPLLARMGWSRW